jgi:hypothetical protein
MANDIIITPGSASIQFSGSANNDTIRLQVEASGSIAFYGNSGSLFSIVDQLSGSLMSVNDISGIPILEVFSDDRVVMGTYNRNTLVVTGSRVGIGTATPQTSSVLDVVGTSVVQQILEPVTLSATAATGTINYDLLTGSVLWYTSNASANWTVNFRGTSAITLASQMETGQSLTATFLVTQGATPYSASAHQIDGVSITPRWQNGSQPLGKASGVDIYSYVIVKTGTGSPPFSLFASKVDFA